MDSVFVEFSAIIGISAVIGFIGLKLKQPLIVSFIIAGIIVGPAFLGVVESTEKIELLAHLGIAILLFIVGLKLDPHIIKTMGRVSLATGLGQVIFTSVIGFLIALGFGMSFVTAIYVSVALTFSSTVIIVKLLSDKKELDSLHGKIAIGFLIVQDIVVILAMIGITAFGYGGGGDSIVLQVLSVFAKGAFLIVLTILATKYLMPKLLKVVATSSEMVTLFAIAWAVVGATFAYMLGFSLEVGAFLAGVSIASTPFRDMIGARLTSLRDFLLLFFFINLGSGLQMEYFGGQIVEAVALSLFVLVGNPLIVMIILGYMGYRKRTGLLAGFTVAQISEFSLILMALGYSVGHVSSETVGLVTLVGLITISASTYMIIYSYNIYNFLAPYLGIFERKNPYREEKLGDELKHPEYVVFGLGRFGEVLANELYKKGKRVLGVDYNPDFLESSSIPHIPKKYGDADNPEFISHLSLEKTKWVVSALRDVKTNKILATSLKDAGFEGKLALSANNESDAKVLYDLGVDKVFIPYKEAALEAALKLCKSD